MDYLVKPWKHQLQAIEMSKHTPDLALFFEMGTGKTGTTINILRHRFQEQGRLLRTLVLGPIIVVDNWRREFAMHSKVKPADIVPLVGPGKKRLALFNQACTDPRALTLTVPKILVTNYEAMEMAELYSAIRLWQPEVIVCDESQRLKNHSSVRAKKVASLASAPSVKHRYILTGTPILNSPTDIFMQYRVLDGGKSFLNADGRPQNFYEFRGTYCEDVNAGMPKHAYFPKYQPRPDRFQQLNDKIYSKALRVLKSDCLDLPPLVKTRVEVELGAEQRRMYDEMKREYITWVNEHENSPEPRAVVAQMAITKALRLQQIASGYAKTDTGSEVKIKDNPRLVALKDLLEELTPNHKVIVWATFHENYRQIAQVCKELNLEYVELHGGVSAADKTRAMDSFRSDPQVRVVIANQAAAGIGVNLVEASYSIFYSRNFSLEQDLQAEARNYRGGSEIHTKVTRIDLVAVKTIDELIIESLANKHNIAERILTWREKL